MAPADSSLPRSAAASSSAPLTAVPPPTIDREDRPFTGIGLTLLAIAFFSVMDGLSKGLAAHYPPLEIAWGRYVFVALFLAPFMLRRAGRPQIRTRRPVLQVARGFCMLGSALFFIGGLATLPIAEASAISFVSPLLITALSIPFLGEKVGIRRWSAVMAGLVGVLIVIRPGTSAFDPAALLPALSAACWAMGIIITRMMQGTEAVLTTIFYSTIVGLALTTIAVPFVWVPPTPASWAVIALMGALSTIGQFFLIRSFKFASASLLAPFSYSQMLWATLIGYFAFHQLPDLATWIGAAIIIGSGLYTLHREHVVRRQRRAAA